MIYFQCDYAEGAIPEVLEALNKTNFEQSIGYSKDRHSLNAKKIIANLVPGTLPHLVVGGTQANFLVIDHILKNYQGVLCAKSGHINVHETGAVEATGHKVLALPSQDGKINAKQIENYVKEHYSDGSVEHIVQPGMVYISFPTETGVIYTKKELQDIHKICKKYNMPLFIDGARLGYGLSSKNCDIKLRDFAKLCDVFYIGGTKQGLLFGEAICFNNKNLETDFRYSIKQKGALLAKGRLLGVQFETIMENNLYFKYSKHAIEEAEKIKTALIHKGIQFAYAPETNQLFPIFTRADYENLKKNFCLEFQCSKKEGEVVRICTSWATKSENTEKLVKAIEKL